jgi:peptide/nickel transport system substrate-binding protein
MARECEINGLRKALLSASGDDRRKIADEIAREAFASVPYVPLGQIKQPTVYRTSQTESLTTGIPVFWNVQKA